MGEREGEREYDQGTMNFPVIFSLTTLESVRTVPSLEHTQTTQKGIEKARERQREE